MGGLADLQQDSCAFRALVLLATLGLACAGLAGTVTLKKGLDFTIFLEEESYLVQIVKVRQ